MNEFEALEALKKRNAALRARTLRLANALEHLATAATRAAAVWASIDDDGKECGTHRAMRRVVEMHSDRTFSGPYWIAALNGMDAQRDIQHEAMGVLAEAVLSARRVMRDQDPTEET